MTINEQQPSVSSQEQKTSSDDTRASRLTKTKRDKPSAQYTVRHQQVFKEPTVQSQVSTRCWPLTSLEKKKTHSSENSKSLAGKSRARIQVYAAHAYGSREAKQSAQDTERA